MRKSIIYIFAAAGIGKSSIMHDRRAAARITDEELAAWKAHHPKLVQCIETETEGFIYQLVMGDDAVFLTPNHCEEDAGDYMDRYHEHVQYLTGKIRPQVLEYVKKIETKANMLNQFTKWLTLRMILGIDYVPEEYAERKYLADELKKALVIHKNEELWKDLSRRARAAYDRYVAEVHVPEIPYKREVQTHLSEAMEWYWNHWNDRSKLHVNGIHKFTSSESESLMVEFGGLDLCMQVEDLKFIRELVLDFDEAIYMVPQACLELAGSRTEEYRQHITELKTRVQPLTLQYSEIIKQQAKRLASVATMLALETILNVKEIPAEHAQQEALANRMREALMQPQNKEIWHSLWGKVKTTCEGFVLTVPRPNISYKEFLPDYVYEGMRSYWKFAIEDNKIYFDYSDVRSRIGGLESRILFGSNESPEIKRHLAEAYERGMMDLAISAFN
jgi:hypothetical protein